MFPRPFRPYSRNFNAGRLSRLLLGLLLGSLLLGCGSQASGIEVSDVWGLPPPSSATAAAFYLMIDNRSPEDDRLIETSSDACGRAEVHRTTVDEGGVMRMASAGQVAIPAGETVHFEPGGLHVMCMDRAAGLETGDRAQLLLSFERAGEITVQVEIREP